MIFRRQGFSLIEIMQTVILMGIIAGLSISFFRRVNVDERLYYATEKQLTQAIAEATRQMCNDSTPYCVTTGDFWNTDNWKTDNCSTFYAGTAYNKTTGYCEITVEKDDDDCPSPTNEAIPPMKKRTSTLCYAEPRCSDGSVAVPYSTIICQNGTPSTEHERPNLDGVKELCFRLHSLINHKQQTGQNTITDGSGNQVTVDYNDLAMTCLNTNGPDECIYGTASNRPCAAIDNPKTNVSLILPNGVRIYNLGNRAVYDSQNATPEHFIYIKYDRINDIKNMVTTATTEDLHIANTIKITLSDLGINWKTLSDGSLSNEYELNTNNE